MSADYDPDGIPPQWALDMAANECGFGPGTIWSSKNRVFQALARRIWRDEEPPVDPMLAVMREAIARYEWAGGYTGMSRGVSRGELDDGIVHALAYLREVGALVDKLP